MGHAPSLLQSPGPYPPAPLLGWEETSTRWVFSGWGQRGGGTRGGRGVGLNFGSLTQTAKSKASALATPYHARHLPTNLTRALTRGLGSSLCPSPRSRHHCLFLKGKLLTAPHPAWDETRRKPSIFLCVCPGCLESSSLAAIRSHLLIFPGGQLTTPIIDS